MGMGHVQVQEVVHVLMTTTTMTARSFAHAALIVATVEIVQQVGNSVPVMRINSVGTAASTVTARQIAIHVARAMTTVRARVRQATTAETAVLCVTQHRTVVHMVYALTQGMSVYVRIITSG